jgi:hypothetical protein
MTGGSDKINNTNSFIHKKDINKTEIYHIHDNGDEPFQVTCDKDGIIIQKAILAKQDELNSLSMRTFYATPFWHIKNFEGYWPGFDSSTDEEHGNSILIKIDKTNYVLISNVIYKFKTNGDEIIDFIAALGNNDIPYPVAYGIENVYFLSEESYIPAVNLKLAPTVTNANDMYNELYGINGMQKVKSHRISNIATISQRHLDYEHVDYDDKNSVEPILNI